MTAQGETKMGKRDKETDLSERAANPANKAKQERKHVIIESLKQ